MRSRRRRRFAWAGAIAVILIGVVVALNGMHAPVVPFGWFAYQPLSGASFIGDANGMFVSRATVIGVAIVVLGLLIVAFLAGYRARGTRRH